MALNNTQRVADKAVQAAQSSWIFLCPVLSHHFDFLARASSSPLRGNRSRDHPTTALFTFRWWACGAEIRHDRRPSVSREAFETPSETGLV